MVNCAAVEYATTVAPSAASTTPTDWPGQGLRVTKFAVEPASSTAVTGVPPRVCTSTLALSCTVTVASVSQSEGTAGAMRSTSS